MYTNILSNVQIITIELMVYGNSSGYQIKITMAIICLKSTKEISIGPIKYNFFVLLFHFALATTQLISIIMISIIIEVVINNTTTRIII